MKFLTVPLGLLALAFPPLSCAQAADIFVPNPWTSKGVIRLCDTGQTDPASGLPIYSSAGCPGGSTSAPVIVSSVLATGVTGQVKVASTGTAVQFGAGAATVINGIQYCAMATNTAPIAIGFTSSVTAATDGTGTGEILQPGACNAKASPNLWVNGPAGNGLSFGVN
jgi:hypothetical protein